MISNSCFTAHRGKALVALTVLAALAASPRVAEAQTDAQKQEAKEHSDRARRFYDLGKYAEAIEEYQKGYLLTDDPNMLYNIGQCYRLTDRPEEAVRFYRNYLRRAPASAPNRGDVDTKIVALEKIIEDRKRAAATTAAPATITPTAPVAAEPAPAAPAVAPPPPPPPVDVITPPPVTAQAPPVATVTQPRAPASSRSRVTGYVLLVGGGALIATALVSGAVASKKAMDLTTLSRNGGVYDPNLQTTGKAANAVAVLTGLVGVAAAAVGGILIYTSRTVPAVASAASGPPVEVAIFPLAGSRFAGGEARVTF
jgi:tetratricopeptide (TPR) repeat protein